MYTVFFGFKAVLLPVTLIGTFLLWNTYRLLTDYHRDLLESDNSRVKNILFEITTQIYNISENLIFDEGLQKFRYADKEIREKKWASAIITCIPESAANSTKRWCPWIKNLSSMAGIDQGLYEAAKVDGANRLKRIWHITLPGIKPTVVVLLIMSIGSALNVGMERQMLLSNGIVQDHAMVLSWFAYIRGIGSGNYGNRYVPVHDKYCVHDSVSLVRMV